MKPPRWTAIAESEFPWEREALDWLRDRLPDTEPWHAWSNFEFIDDDGKVNEVDVLVLAPGGLFLVEIKSRPGVLTGDAGTWTWLTDGREFSYDNPLYLTNRKAKRLASLLRTQPSVVKARERMPWVEPAIFLSSTSLNSKLEGPARAKTYLRGQPGAPSDDGIVAALFSVPNASPLGAPQLVDHRQARAIARAMAEAGIRPSTKHRRVGDYQLESLISDGVNYQDWLAKHVSVETRRRLRIYSYGKVTSPESRQALARQARREFQILEGVESPGILKVLDYKESELGPALVFEHDPNAERLDHYVQRRREQLGIGRRLYILRELAETLRYAHKKRLYHRALSPASVLVRETTELNRPLRILIMNWQTGAREGSGTGSSVHTTGTQHVDEYVEDPARVYLAPEALHGLSPAGPSLDVFALGAIAHLVLAGAPPATDPTELAEKLRRGPGLRLSDALDGAADGLQDLVRFSTHPEVSARISSIDEFIEYLDLAEDELTAPEPERVADPSTAKPGDRIGAGFTVAKYLGRGSFADVLLVKRDGSDEELVLKVAGDARYNDRLIGEGETLRKLRHQNVVAFQEVVEVAGRTAILMRKAGEKTLAQRLREEGRLSLDLLRRFGEELLEALRFMEDAGVTHRDIKPDNVGIAPVGERGMLHAVLFDFSLARTPAENILAGTPGYLDPFLSLRKPPRWDLYAERYAAAVTLYEMATGTLPVWGDGQTAPDMLDCDATLNTDAFDPNVREGLSVFFEKALRRDFRQRFDNAEEMLRAWRRLFDEARQPTTTPDALDAIARLATGETTIGELGYSVDAQNVLERMGIHNLRELLAVDRIKFRYLTNVGDKVRKEIRLTAKRLAQLRPDLVPGRLTVTGDETPDLGPASIDELAGQLLPKRPAGDDRADERAVALYLGLEPNDALGDWPALGEVARAAGLSRSAAADAVLRLRERWLKAPPLTVLRDDIAKLLEAHSGVLMIEELVRALLAARGSAEQDDATRVRLASAVARASVEAETERGDQRFQVFHGGSKPLVASRPELADYARRLGVEADRLAQQDPLLAPSTALRELEAVPSPEGTSALPPQRLLRLAAAASRAAAVSSRSEIYPVGMSPLQAIRQSLGALVGPRVLAEKDLTDRVRGRYPACAPLPSRPELDRLLEEAGAGLVWRTASGSEPAGYVPAHAITASVGSTTLVERLPTQTADPGEITDEIAAARAFEEKLNYVLEHGGFLALTTTPRLGRHVQAELSSRFDAEVESFDDLLIEAMLEQASALKVDWSVVLKADGAAPASADWRNLLRLASRAAAQVKEGLASRRKPVLITDPGLLARYELMPVVSELQAAAGRPGSTPAVLLLVPMARPAAPSINGVVVPVIAATQWARVPEAWVNNAHRAGTQRA